MKKNKIKSGNNNKNEINVFNFSSSTKIEKIIYYILLFITLLHVLGVFIDSPYAWGFNYISFLHPALKLFFIAFAVFMFLPIGQKYIFSGIQYLANMKNKIPKPAGYILLVLISLGIFWILRVKVFVLGDASLMFQSLNLEDLDTWTNREMLTTRVVAFFYEMLRSSGPASIINAYIIVSLISGIIFIIAITQIAKLLGKNDIEKMLIFIFLVLSGSSLLFFGYVENYPILYAFMSLYLLFALRFLLGKSSILFALLSYAVVFLLHMGALALMPTLLYLFYVEIKRKHVIRVIIYLVILAVIFGLLLFISGNGWVKLVKIFSQPLSLLSGNAVPFSTMRGDFSAYTMFSFWHFLDFINHQILVNPLALLSIIISMIYFRKKIDWKEPVFLFLFTGSVLAIVMEFTINHIYGMSKDWDVMAPYVIIFALLCLYLLNNKFDLISNKNWIVSLVTGVMLLHTVPYILVYSSEDSAIARSKSLENENIMPKIGIIVTDMNIGEYFRLNSNFQKAEEIYKNLISKYPRDSRGFLLLSKLYDVDLKNPQKALEITKAGVDMGIRSKKLWSNLGQHYYKAGKYDMAVSLWTEIIKADTNYHKIFPSLGYVYALKGKYDSAVVFLEKALPYDENNTGIYQNLGNCYLALGNYQKSIQNYEKFLLFGKAALTVYKNLGICYSMLGNKDMTKKYWSKYLEQAPSGAEYDMIKNKLEGMNQN